MTHSPDAAAEKKRQKRLKRLSRILEELPSKEGSYWRLTRFSRRRSRPSQSVSAKETATPTQVKKKVKKKKKISHKEKSATSKITALQKPKIQRPKQPSSRSLKFDSTSPDSLAATLPTKRKLERSVISTQISHLSTPLPKKRVAFMEPSCASPPHSPLVSSGTNRFTFEANSDLSPPSSSKSDIGRLKVSPTQSPIMQISKPEPREMSKEELRELVIKLRKQTATQAKELQRLGKILKQYQCKEVRLREHSRRLSGSPVSRIAKRSRPQRSELGGFRRRPVVVARRNLNKVNSCTNSPLNQNRY